MACWRLYSSYPRWNEVLDYLGLKQHFSKADIRVLFDEGFHLCPEPVHLLSILLGILAFEVHRTVGK